MTEDRDTFTDEEIQEMMYEIEVDEYMDSINPDNQED